MIDVSPELQAFLKEEYDRCLDEMLEQERETAIDRYNGEPYGDEEDGSSQVVARDTAETIDYMVISIMRTLVSGDRVVEFMHKNTDAAHEATETIMHLLMDEQDGYQILHDWLKSGLLEKNAVAMTYPEKQPKKRVEGIVPAPMMPEDALEAEPAGMDPETGMKLFRVVVQQEQGDKFCDAAVPNEEFYCSPDARTIEEAALKGRRVRKTLSDLVEMGYPQDEVETISSNSRFDTTVAMARNEDRYDGSSARSGMARMVWWHEEYVRFDANGDGIAETLYVQRSEDYKVFAIDEVEEDDCPFVDWCPYPMPHRRVGQSLADKVMDLERVNTVLMRQTLNGIYLGNNPSTYVHEDAIGENTIEDLLTVRPGRLVRWKGAVPPQERGASFDPGVGFTAMEFIDRRRETRTGITRLNMGLDEDTLNQTAKGQAQLIARGEQQEEYIARNFANAVAKLITKKAKLLQRNGKPIMVPIDGEYREVNPRNWPEDMIARARVGLGASRKDQRVMFIREVLEGQAAAMDRGLGIVTEDKIYNAFKAFCKDTGVGDVTEFFEQPKKGPDGKPLPKEEKPDPEMMKVQMEARRDQQKLQGEQQMTAAKLQGEQQIANFKLQAQREEAMQKQQLARVQASFEAGLARDKAEFEAALAEEKMNREWALETKRMERDDEMAKNRPGGRLDA